MVHPAPLRSSLPPSPEGCIKLAARRTLPPMKKHVLAVLLLLLSAPGTFGQELSAADLDRRRKALADLIDEQWEYTMKHSPEYASILGDKRYNDQVSDVSESAVRAELADTKRFLRRFEAIGTQGFSEQERLNRDLMVKDLRESVESAKFNWWQMPGNQMNGIHLGAAQLPSVLPFQTVKDYDDYVVRLRKLPRILDDTIANMRKGMNAKLMPPKFLLEKVGEQGAGIANTPVDKSPFAVPIGKFPDGVSDAEKQRIRTAVLAE